MAIAKIIEDRMANHNSRKIMHYTYFGNKKYTRSTTISCNFD